MEQHGAKEILLAKNTEEEVAFLTNLEPADFGNDDWVARYHRKFGPSRNRKGLGEKWQRITAKQDLPDGS